MCANVSGGAICYANALRNRIAIDNHHSGHCHTREHRNPVFDGHCSQCEPGIDFDEVHRHIVFNVRRQHERLLDIVMVAFDVVAAADVPIVSACGDFAARPSLEVFSVVKVGGDRNRRYNKNVSNGV